MGAYLEACYEAVSVREYTAEQPIAVVAHKSVTATPYTSLTEAEMNSPRTAWTAISALLFFVASAQSATPPATPPAATPVATPGNLPLAKVSNEASKELKLQKKPLGNMQPVHALGDIYLAGQPTPQDLLLFKQGGIKTVVTLRKPGEVPWDEAAAVSQQGMKFVSVPFQRPAELKTEVFEKVLKVLRDKERGPTVLHCGSANRVGAIWYAYRVLDDKLSPEAALKEAKVVGLRTPGYIVEAQAYVKKIQSQPLKADLQEPQVNR